MFRLSATSVHIQSVLLLSTGSHIACCYTQGWHFPFSSSLEWNIKIVFCCIQRIYSMLLVCLCTFITYIVTSISLQIFQHEDQNIKNQERFAVEAWRILKIDHKLLWMVLIKIMQVYRKKASDDYASTFYNVKSILSL